MIRFEDFEAQQLKAPGFFTGAKYEEVDTVLETMNAWIAAQNVEVVNIETVVLPNIYSKDEEGTKDVSLGIDDKLVTTWHQFFRVWYRV